MPDCCALDSKGVSMEKQLNIKVSEASKTAFGELAKAEGISKGELFEQMVKAWKTKEPMLPILFQPQPSRTDSIAHAQPSTLTLKPGIYLDRASLAILCGGILLLFALILRL